jgi:hypothetical protein
VKVPDASRHAIIGNAPSRIVLIALAVASIVFICGAAELVLRAAAGLGLVELLPPPTASKTWARDGWVVDRDLHWVRPPNYTGVTARKWFRTNSFGLRDREMSLAKPAETVRILALGDSTVFGFRVPIEATFSKRLEALLNQDSGDTQFEVINAGVQSYSLYNSFVYLKRDGIRFDPDLILLETNYNDRRYIPSRFHRDGPLFYRYFWYSMRFRDAFAQSYVFRGLRRVLLENPFAVARRDSQPEDLIGTGEYSFLEIEMNDLHCRVSPARYDEMLKEFIDYSLAREIPVVLVPLRDPPDQLAAYREAVAFAEQGSPKRAIEGLKEVLEGTFHYRLIAAAKINEIVDSIGQSEERIDRIPVPVEWMGTGGNVPIFTADPYIDSMRRAAERPGVIVAEIDPQELVKQALYMDYIHLNALGHELLAQSIHRAIRESDEIDLGR